MLGRTRLIISLLAFIVYAQGLLFIKFVLVLPASNTSSQVAVIFPKDLSLAQSLASIVHAGGLLVRYGATHNIVIAQPTSPHFNVEILKHGAYMVVNPLAIGGCFVRTNTKRIKGISGDVYDEQAY